MKFFTANLAKQTALNSNKIKFAKPLMVILKYIRINAIKGKYFCDFISKSDVIEESKDLIVLPDSLFKIIDSLKFKEIIENLGYNYDILYASEGYICKRCIICISW